MNVDTWLNQWHEVQEPERCQRCEDGCERCDDGNVPPWSIGLIVGDCVDSEEVCDGTDIE
jgi:hypothetical protein